MAALSNVLEARRDGIRLGSESVLIPSQVPTL